MEPIERLFCHTNENYIIQCRDSYVPFVQRRLGENHLYQQALEHPSRENKRYFKHLADEIFVFSLYMRHTPVRRNRSEVQGTILDAWEKLHLLHSHPEEPRCWDDARLWILFRRTSLGPISKRARSYRNTLDDIGQDSEVVGLWGRPIVYSRDIYQTIQDGRFRVPA